MTLRIGILGAARIVPPALIRPAQKISDVQVVAVAARAEARARDFAHEHKIPRVLASYDALINDSEIDAIYNPLPNSLHCEWTVRALRAGKHVLCEKPLASNAREAEEMTRAAEESGCVLMEAYHSRYHPLFQRVLDILASGEIGTLRAIEADFFIPLFFRGNDIRFQYALAGGATMDTGCYCIHLIRNLSGMEPHVVRAEARLSSPQVDRLMRAEFQFENGAAGKMACSLAAFPPFRAFARLRGDKGELSIRNPYVPQYFNHIDIKTANGKRREKFTHEPTYNFQLRAFLAATRDEPANLTDGNAGIKTMHVIDAVYERAGLKPRGT
jgi:predicted dehydrogenase